MTDEFRYPAWFGPYELLGRLGQGASGSAHLARPGSSTSGVPTPVVIKRLHGRVAHQTEHARRFRHEAEIAVLVDSPHVARVFDVGTVDGRLYIALEYVPGWTLGKLLGVLHHRGRPPPVQVSAEIARQFLRGLQELHEARDRSGRRLDIVHRDVSPKNLMVGDDGRVRIIDLGLGKSRVQDWKTRAGRVMGSPGYMPPEQIAGRFVDQRADIYAAAVLVHELFTAERYITGADPVAMLRVALEKSYEPVRMKRSDVPDELDDVLQAAMWPEVSRRTPDAASFLRDIERTFGPGPGRPTAVAEWVRATLPSEQSARRAEVRRLLSLPCQPPPEDGPDHQDTEVWVARDGVAHDGTHVIPEVSPTRLTASPSSAGTERVSESGAGSFVVWREGGGERARLALALAIGVGIGATGMHLYQGGQNAVLLSDTPPAPPVRRPDATVLASPRPGASKPLPEEHELPVRQPSEAEEEQPVDLPRSPPAKAGEDQGAQRAEGKRRPRAPPRLSEAARAEALAARLKTRASGLRQNGQPRVARGAARVLSRVSLAERVPNESKRLEQLKALEKELGALESSVGRD